MLLCCISSMYICLPIAQRMWTHTVACTCKWHLGLHWLCMQNAGLLALVVFLGHCPMLLQDIGIAPIWNKQWTVCASTISTCVRSFCNKGYDHRSMYPRLPRLVNYCGLKIDLWRVICKLAFSEGAMSAEDQHNLGLDRHALHWISVKHDFVHLILSSTFHCSLLSNQLAKSNNELKRRNTACTQDNCSAKKLSHTLRRYNLRSLVQLSTCCV